MRATLTRMFAMHGKRRDEHIMGLRLSGLPNDLMRIGPRDLSLLSESARGRLNEVLQQVDTKGYPGLTREIEHILAPQTHLANFSTVLGHAAYIADRGGSHGLDVGCSFGLKTVMLKYFGCGRIDACDVSETLIEGAKYWSLQSGMEGLVFAKNPSAELPYESQRYDWVTAMGLYANLDPRATKKLFEECFRVLKPGGVFLFHDGANPHHGPTVDAMVKHHSEQELGDGTLAEPNGPVFRQRLSFILEKFPGLNTGGAKELARRTCYMGKEEISEACEVFLREGVMPDSTFVLGSLQKIPLRIENRTPCRRPTDPMVIFKELQMAGFSAVEFRRPVVGGLIPVPEALEYYRGAPGVFLNARKSI